MGMLAKIRRMHIRNGLSLRAVARRTRLSRNTIRRWLRQADVVEPKYSKRETKSVVDLWADQLSAWLRADSHRAKRERRTALVMYQTIKQQGYLGSYNRVCAFVRSWKSEQAGAPKQAASRAFCLVAYMSQSHEMLFDAHAKAFAAFGGVPRRGIYDNMKTAVDRVGRGKQRTINARFEAMCSHYLFDPEFCNRAAGWEKGIVEKDV